VDPSQARDHTVNCRRLGGCVARLLYIESVDEVPDADDGWSNQTKSLSERFERTEDESRLASRFNSR
jgi:hypothetical protein